MTELGVLEEVEDLEPVGGSDSEDEVVDDYSHSKLLAAIGSLGGKKKQHVERSEPAAQVSEYHVTTSNKKVGLADLVGALKQQTGHRELKKKLNRIDDKKKVLNVPLPKAEQERIQRSLTYEHTRKEVSKWEPVVRSNREAEQLIFPLGKPDVHLLNTDQFVQRFKPRTPLEMEVAALLSGSQSQLPKQCSLTPAEERALKAMSLSEARARRAELQKYRALLSYKEAKARRQNKIKSKKYHRILRKDRQKKEIKALEELQKSDPEAYMEKINKMEKERAEERMSLKHRGGSKFMQRMKIFGKYDDKARQSIQDMIQKNKDLTSKMAGEEESSGEESVIDLMGEEEEDISKDTSYNPWMSAVPVKKKPVSPIYNKPQAFVDEAVKPVVLSDSDVTETSPKKAKIFEIKVPVVPSESNNEQDPINVESSAEESEDGQGNQLNIIDADIDQIFKAGEQKIMQHKQAMQKDGKTKLNQKVKQKKRKRAAVKPKKKEVLRDSDSDFSDSDSDDGIQQINMDSREQDDAQIISGSLTRRKTLEDFEDNWSEDEGDEGSSFQVREKFPGNQDGDTTLTAKLRASSGKEIQVDPKKFMTIEKKIKPAIAANIVTNDSDDDPEEQQRLTIAQAFAQDDVVEEFAEEKRNIEKRDKPKDIDLTLPGWGEWGGVGLKVSRKKRKRFIMKAPPGPPRKDKALTGVIISETKDRAVAKHQVNVLPFPFKAVHQFESSIRAPLGKTWNPETSFKKLVAPKVKTHLGAIIKPLDKAQAFDKDKLKKRKTDDDNDDQSPVLQQTKKVKPKGKNVKPKGKHKKGKAKRK